MFWSPRSKATLPPQASPSVGGVKGRPAGESVREREREKERERDRERETWIQGSGERVGVRGKESGVVTTGRALRLVTCDERGKFSMDHDAVMALRSLKGPLAVVSVCGRARQGKSFILNQLLGQSSGFIVGPTHRPCTKGLWMWSLPIERKASDGSKYNLLLLDTEGIEACDQTGTYSTQIFSLAVLLSSLFVFNQMGGIDESALDSLALVTELTKHIRIKAESHTSSPIAPSAHELGQYSPFFVWLLRDFYLDLTEDGRKITPRDYLEQSLERMPGTSASVLAKNQIRDSIRALFPERECFALVRPLNEETQLQHLDKLPKVQLRPEFCEGIQKLTSFIFEKAIPKRMGSAVLTGPILASLTQAYLDALNNGAVPTIASSWQNVEEQQCRLALDNALHVYSNSFDKKTGAQEDALNGSQNVATNAALKVFHDEAMGTGIVRERFEGQLVTTMKERFEEYKERLFKEAELRCAQALSSMDSQLMGIASNRETSLDMLLEALSNMVAEYEGSAEGPSKWPRLASFLLASMRGVMRNIALQSQERVKEQEKECVGLRDEASEWKRRADSVGAQLSECFERVKVAEREAGRRKEEAAALQMQLVSLQATHGSGAREKADMQRHVEEVEQKLKDADLKIKELQQQETILNKLMEQHAKKRKECETTIATTEAKLVNSENRHNLTVSMHAKEVADLRIRLENAGQKLRAVERTIADWEKRHREAVEELQKHSQQAYLEKEELKKTMKQQHDEQLRKKDMELQQLRTQHKEQLEESSRLASELQFHETQLQFVNQALSASRLETQALREQVEEAAQVGSSSQRELHAAREAQSGIEAELQRTLQAFRQAESARVAADLRVRQESELRLQAQEQVDELKGKLKNLQSLQEEVATLKTQSAKLEAEVIQKGIDYDALLAEKMRLDDVEKRSVSEEVKQEVQKTGRKRARPSTFKGEDEDEEERKLTKELLKQKITAAGAGPLIFKKPEPNRKELLEIYREHAKGK